MTNDEKYVQIVKELTDMAIKLRIESLDDLKNGNKKLYEAKDYISKQIDMMVFKAQGLDGGK